MSKIRTKPKLQLRRCAVCQKIGHNKSTCPQMMTVPIQNRENAPPINGSQPLKFYIHHVTDEPKKSHNVIDLKKHNIWNEINACAPFLNEPTGYNNYHHLTTSPRHVPKQKLTRPTTDGTDLEQFLPTDQSATINPISFSPQKNNLNVGLPESSRQIKFNLDLKKKAIRTTNYVKLNTIGLIANLLYHLRQWQKIYFPLKRTIVSLTLFSLIIFAPTHAKSYYQNLVVTAQKIKSDGEQAYGSLEKSTTQLLSGDISQAQTNITVALAEFALAVKQMEDSHPYLQTIAARLPILKNKINSQKALIIAGQNITLGNELLLGTINKIQNSSSTLLKNIEIINNDLSLALPYYDDGLKNINSADVNILPTDYQDKFLKFQKMYATFVSDLNNINNSADAIKIALGGQGVRRYLLVFQNENEIRPTGGFIGSYALLEIKNGQINKLEIPAGGSYDIQSLLDKNVEPPAPLLMIANRWHFRDANWFADFPTSAEKLMWFYRHSRHITTDGVIAVNASVLERLLTVTGPIDDKNRGVKLSAANAVETIQKIVEEGPEKTNAEPKKIIGELAVQFINDFQKIDAKKTLDLLSNFQDALVKKEIQLHFVDNLPEQTVKKYGWNGGLADLKDNQDYLLVINANINGRKSDAKMAQKISHQSVVQPDGSIINTVTIQRTHSGQAGEEFYGYPNTNYIRLYVPKGSQLLKSGGFTWLDENFFKAPDKYAKTDPDLTNYIKEVGFDPLTGTGISEETNKTVFGNWLVTEPGKTNAAYFTYKLPFKIIQQTKTEKKWFDLMNDNSTSGNYQLIVQKQSGIVSDFNSTIIFPNDWSPTWNQGQQMKLASNGAVIEGIKLNTDMVWSLIMKK